MSNKFVTFQERVLALAWQKYGEPLPDIVADKLSYEITVIEENHFEPEFEMISDVCAAYCKSEGSLPLFTTPVGSSVVAFLLGIVANDPIKNGLYSEMLFGTDGKRKNLFSFKGNASAYERLRNILNAVCIENCLEIHEAQTTQPCSNEKRGNTYRVASSADSADIKIIELEYNVIENNESIIYPQSFPRSREELADFLIGHNIPRKQALTITEYVRKGLGYANGFPTEYLKIFQVAGIAEDVIETLSSIKYLPSKAAMQTA